MGFSALLEELLSEAKLDELVAVIVVVPLLIVPIVVWLPIGVVVSVLTVVALPKTAVIVVVVT